MCINLNKPFLLYFDNKKYDHNNYESIIKSKNKIIIKLQCQNSNLIKKINDYRYFKEHIKTFPKVFANKEIIKFPEKISIGYALYNYYYYKNINKTQKENKENITHVNVYNEYYKYFIHSNSLENAFILLHKHQNFNK